MDMCEGFAIVYNGEETGRANVAYEGIRLKITAAVRKNACPAPFRLAVNGENGMKPLGVMLPANGGFSFSRIYSPAECRRLGLSGPMSFTIIPCGDERNTEEGTARNDGEWKELEHPERLFEEGEFRHIFSACEKALVRRENELTLIAVPVRKGEPFPIMQVFCLGELWKIGGKLYLVFKIRDGKLLFDS